MEGTTMATDERIQPLTQAFAAGGYEVGPHAGVTISRGNAGIPVAHPTATIEITIPEECGFPL
jgi:hypothetical protein